MNAPLGTRRLVVAFLVGVAICPQFEMRAFASVAQLHVDPAAFRIVPSESGPDNYFQRVPSPSGEFIRASYEPPFETAVLGFAFPEEFRQDVTSLTWRWRAQTLPIGADERVKGRNDSAAVVYVSWRRGLRWYVLKYVWSTSAPRGTVCAKKRNPFGAQDTIVLESGGPPNEWKSVRLNLATEFRSHFEGGSVTATVPDLIGIGLMSDGDQTESKSAADFGDFVLSR